MLTALDLFHGACGGWSLGFHRAGIRTVAACEIDPWRRDRYGRNFPDVRLYDDVRSLTADRLRADGVGAIDVVAGSPPCQDASTANTKGKGIDGARTGLFFEALRLVRELRPRWVCLENVPGLRTRGYDRVHDELEAAGYTVRPLVVGAWHAGAPHRRNRVWIIANRAAVLGPEVAGHQSDGNSERVAADVHQVRCDEAAEVSRPRQSEPANVPERRLPPNAHGDRVRLEPGRSGGADGQGAAESEGRAPALSNCGGEPGRAFNGEVVRLVGDAFAHTEEVTGGGRPDGPQPQSAPRSCRQSAAKPKRGVRLDGGTHARRTWGELMATPTKRDWKSSASSTATMERNSRPLNEQLRNDVAPSRKLGTAELLAVAEWMMGYPKRWLGPPWPHSATPSSRKLQNSLGGSSSNPKKIA